MTDRKWFKRDNGLWSSYDEVIRRQKGQAVAREVRERLAALIERDGWTFSGRKWTKPV